VNPELVATLKSALSENTAHSEKIRKSVMALGSLVPLTKDTFESLGDETIMVIDQFIYRFTKMQDSLGTRLLPTLFALLEDDRPRPFLDVLNRLEQLRVIDSVDTWQFFRDLRNRFAHDYPESVEQTVQTINLLHREVERFLGLFESARAVCLARFLC